MQSLWRGDWLQRIRLTSGLILFAFATTHFLNHAPGLVCVDLMQDVQNWRLVVTRSLPGTIVLAAALVAHIGLALFKFSRRRTLRLPWWERMQLALGLAIPFLLFPHIVNTRFANTLFAVNDTYLYELARLWPGSAITQSALLLMVWIHGCAGIHFWLRLQSWYRRLWPVLLAFAVFVPVAALGGFMVAGRGIAILISDPEMLGHVKAMSNWPNDADSATLAGWRNYVRLVFGILIAVAAGYIILDRFARHMGPKVEITYTGGPRALFHLPGAHRPGPCRITARRVPSGRHPCKHRRSRQCPSGLPNCTGRRFDSNAPAASGPNWTRSRRSRRTEFSRS